MEVSIAEIKLKNPKVPQSMAMDEFQKWLDYKKTKITLVFNQSSSKDEDEDEEESSKATTEIIEAIMDGNLIVNEDLSLSYNLMFPVKDDSGQTALGSLTMKPRLTADEVAQATKGVTKKDPQGVFIGYLHVLSGEVKGLIRKIDSQDYSLLQKIVMYFL